MPDTNRLYPELTAELAALALDDERVLRPADFGVDLAAMMVFGRLVINKLSGRTICESVGEDRPFEVERFVPSHDWFALRGGYGDIGLGLFHLLFSGRSWAGLQLTHPCSTVAALN